MAGVGEVVRGVFGSRTKPLADRSWKELTDGADQPVEVKPRTFDTIAKDIEDATDLRNRARLRHSETALLLNGAEEELAALKKEWLTMARDQGLIEREA